MTITVEMSRENFKRNFWYNEISHNATHALGSSGHFYMISSEWSALVVRPNSDLLEWLTSREGTWKIVRYERSEIIHTYPNSTEALGLEFSNPDTALLYKLTWC